MAGLALPWSWWAVRGLGWPADVVAIAMPLLVLGVIGSAAAVALAAVVLEERRHRSVLRAGLAGLAASAVAAGVLTVAGPWRPRPTPAPAPPTAVTLAAFNLYNRNDHPDAALASVARAGADVVVVSEATGYTAAGMKRLYPYTVSTRAKGTYFQLVASRFPLRHLDDTTGVAVDVVRVEVDAPQPFVLYGAHLDRPGFGTGELGGRVGFGPHRHEVARLHVLARAEALPTVIAGDLNLSDRAWGYRLLTEDRVDALRSGWTGPTYVEGALWRLLALRIDHILLDPGWCAAAAGRPAIDGSDHRGVIATVGPCPRA